MPKKSNQKRNGSRRQQRTNHRVEQGAQVVEEVGYFLEGTNQKASKEPLEAKSEAQGHYMLSIESNDVTFGLGPAGVGKTYLATAMACEALLAREVKKIYITRPMVDAEEDIGYLPGDVADKFAPFFTPVREVLEERLGVGFTEYLIKHKRIEICPFAFLRGRTLKDAYVILDEAQNTTPKQMKLFLTRLGENVNVIINGDSTQQDIKGPNGLDEAYRLFNQAPGFGSVVFEAGDVRRSALAERIVSVYESVA